ncbi:MAG: sulfate adenylyltransferase subunit CysN [Acetobacteraceae bacterium]|nr:sulfate adenylyltransferase subunit CysN [Acetobacteraceae bacterium]
MNTDLLERPELRDAATQARIQPAIRPTSLLRFLTCGSVDDGKSTLIGRMLHDAGLVPTDQLESLEKDSRRYGTTGGVDYALLVDGLAAEREQGITIDVAYRYFATSKRAFIVADTPGHQQYTRNMATGAAGADLAVILVDARKGILPQTRRHSFIAGMLRVRHLVLAVNKMDLVGFDKNSFDALVAEYRRAVEPLGFASITAIPLCAREGDNLVLRSLRMPWYSGPTLLGLLETIDAGQIADTTAALRLPVQWVNRRSENFRGYAGTIAHGSIAPGDKIRVLPSGLRGTVARVVTADGDLPRGIAGQAITLTLREEIDISRGDVIVGEADRLTATRELSARILWMDEKPLDPAAEYEIRIGCNTANARISAIRHTIDIHSYAPTPSAGLEANGIGLVELKLDRPVVAAAYDEDCDLGGFILVDKHSNATAALGMVTEQETAAPAASAPALREWHGRSLIKAASWRAIGSIDTFILSWIFTGQVKTAGTIAFTEVFTKIGLYYLHERAWVILPWGKVGGSIAGEGYLAGVMRKIFKK